MKILHTADWHLGKRLDFFSRLDEQYAILDEICAIAEEEQVDAIIIAGDLFDTFNPPVEAVELLYRTLRRLSLNGQRPVIAIAGNHDSADRIDAPDSLALECGIIFVGYPYAQIRTIDIPEGFSITKSEPGFIEITLPKHGYPLRILHTAYANELRLKQYLGLENKEQQLNELLKQRWHSLANQYADKQGVNILTAHLYMLKRGGEVLEEPEGEKPIKVGNADLVYSEGIPPQIQYTALGHLHRFQNIGGHSSPVVYSSSPLAYSFSETGQKKHVVIVEAQPDQPVHYRPVELKQGRQLFRMRFDQVDQAVQWLTDNPYTLVELTLVSDEFIPVQKLKRIHDAHDGIIHIIPVVLQQQPSNPSGKTVNIDQNIEGLFNDYFKHRTGQQPNSELMDLFNEVLNSNTETED